MIVVVDTGPLIALAKIDRIELLQDIGSTIVIPPAVERELLSQPSFETQVIEEALSRFIEVRSVAPFSAGTKEAVRRLDVGERQAIGYAAELDENTLLVIDDRVGRRVARHLGCSITGVVGILLRVKEQGAVEAVTPLLVELREAGYWLSDAIIRHARVLADETNRPFDS